MVLVLLSFASIKIEGDKSKGIQNDTKTQGSYVFRKVRKSRSVLFGKEELMRNCNEITKL